MKALKNILVIWVAIYPTITVLLWFFGASLNTLPLPLRTLVLTVVLVPLMVLVLVPFWTRQLERVLVLWKDERPQNQPASDSRR